MDNLIQHNFRNMIIWRKGIELTKENYQLIKSMTLDDKIVFGRQMIRCCLSIPANIAEGSGRGSDKDFRRFLKIAIGSALEYETHLTACLECEVISEEKYNDLLSKIHFIQVCISNFSKNLKTK